ncbi:hypothetical protein ACFYZB_04170 [Streptomyces sp. NPDC001852]|uniref:hypothetical protein n=1 Tax=Streptomyces sp. NPDC001852 TaxID=3364619 RepID=UPI00367F4C92
MIAGPPGRAVKGRALLDLGFLESDLERDQHATAESEDAMGAMDAPERLGNAGLGLWQAVLTECELTPGEMALLVQACRTVDELETISRALAEGPAVVKGSTGQPKASTLFAEARAHRLVLGKLLEQMALPDLGEEEGMTPNQQRAQKAAQTRWALERAKNGAA